MFNFFKKKIENTPKPKVNDFSITPNVEQIKEEKEFINSFIEIFISRLNQSNEFEKKQSKNLENLLKRSLEPFQRKEIKKLLNTGQPLTVHQKKEFGFNTRLKICTDYLNFIDISNIDKNNPFNFLVYAEFYARSRSYCFRDIKRCQHLSVKKVKLIVLNESCPNSVQFQGVYDINKAPILPLLTCGNKCLCMYVAEAFF